MVTAASNLDVAAVLLGCPPAVSRSLENLEHLDVDRVAAERLCHTLGPIHSDGGHDFHRADQASGEREVHGGPSQRLIDLAKSAVARVKGYPAAYEVLSLRLMPPDPDRSCR